MKQDIIPSYFLTNDISEIFQWLKKHNMVVNNFHSKNIKIK